MRILFISPTVPHPPHDGGRLRLHRILSWLAESHEVVFLSCGSSGSLEGWDLAGRLAAPPILSEGAGPARADSWSPRWGIPGILMDANYNDAKMWGRLRDLDIGGFDVVHAQTACMAGYALSLKRSHPGIRLVCDLHDVFSGLLLKDLRSRRERVLSRGWLRRVRDLSRSLLLEREMVRGLDALTVCSERERETLLTLSGRRYRGRIVVVPNTIDIPHYRGVGPSPEAPRLLFVGLLSYMPNHQGAMYFLEKVLPLIRARIPGAEFWVVGRSPRPELRRATEGRAGVRLIGHVPDVRPYLERCPVAVVPLLFGGGTRTKILEAMAASRPVVSTSIGAEGLDVEHGTNILIADRPREFADACVALLGDVELRKRIARAGLELVRDRYTDEHSRRKVLDLYRSLDDHSRPGTRPSVRPSRAAGSGALHG